jgi:chromosome partitioning protein
MWHWRARLHRKEIGEDQLPIIVAANTKGGSGKSTTCLVLGTTLAQNGATVRIIDADPQGTLRRWRDQGISKYREIVVTPTPGEDLTELIDKLASEYQFVVIDVQGTANKELVAAMSRASLVLIPMRAKTADADVATQAISLLRSQERLFRRAIPHGVVFIATSQLIKTREERMIQESVANAHIPCFQTALNERAAFSEIHAYRCALDELDPKVTNGIDKAKANAYAFMQEVLHTLQNGNAEKEVNN